jgi:uncharacterized OsmC-like protein
MTRISKRQTGKRPSPLQYFIASIGFCMFSQFARLAAKAEISIDDLEMDLRMTYDLTGKFLGKNFPDAAQGISYIFKIRTNTTLDTVIKVAQAADRACHTVNSMRKRMPVSGKLMLNDRPYEIGD